MKPFTRLQRYGELMRTFREPPTGPLTALQRYDEHARSYSSGASKEWYRKASELALRVGTPAHTDLAWYHFKDSGGKRGQWNAWRKQHQS